MSDKKPPLVKAKKWLSHTRLFHVEELQLQFSNGVERTYERLNPGFHRAVMVVPILDADTLVMVREFGAGVDDYYWSFPKGAIDEGEKPECAADRELKEEAGYGVKDLQPLAKLALSPSYMGNQMHILLGQDLYQQHEEGDEPEPMEVKTLSWAEIEAMIAAGEIYEAYAVAAFYLAKKAMGIS